MTQVMPWNCRCTLWSNGGSHWSHGSSLLNLRGSPWSCGGSPWSCGGSPWSCGGSPWSCGGSPWSCGGSHWSCGGSPLNKGTLLGSWKLALEILVHVRKRALEVWGFQTKRNGFMSRKHRKITRKCECTLVGCRSNTGGGNNFFYKDSPERKTEKNIFFWPLHSLCDAMAIIKICVLLWDLRTGVQEKEKSHLKDIKHL